jgi:hypothetical protein
MLVLLVQNIPNLLIKALRFKDKRPVFIHGVYLRVSYDSHNQQHLFPCVLSISFY